VYSVILENIDRISQLGFDLRDFGDSTVIVYAVPDGFPTEEEALKEVMDNLAASLDLEIGGENIQSYAHTLAKAAADKLSHNLNPVQAQMLANDVLMLRATYGTDLATRCIAIVSTEDLEKRL
jgi:DNA mismatch repair ATPase MutL